MNDFLNTIKLMNHSKPNNLFRDFSPRNSLITCLILCFLTFLPALGADAHRPKVVFLVGEAEYGSEVTMPALAKQFEEKLGFEIVILKSEEDSRDLPDLAALEDADLLVMFIRFRIATEQQFAQLKQWFDQGKPAIAFRTTSHGFWEDKGWFVPYFGGHYKTHAGNRTGTLCVVAPEAVSHPIFHGVESEFRVAHGGTYAAQPLSDFVTPLLFGRTGDIPAQPIGWTAEYRPGQRLFYTSLGAEENFKHESFQNMVLNAGLWCLKQEVPSGGVLKRQMKLPVTLNREYPSPPSRTLPKEAQSLSNLDQWRHWDPSGEPKAMGIDERADTTIGGPVFSNARWKHENRQFIARPGFGDIVTTHSFGDSVYHIDFMIPDEPEHMTGSFRGNSGVYVDGRWEVQIVDSYGQHTVDDKYTCGAIFGVAAPSVNACAKPGTWQQMEIAVKHTEGNSALISVWLNGIQIHDRVHVEDRTEYGFILESEEEEDEESFDEEMEGPPPVPLFASTEEQAKQCVMEKDFTAVVRFRTEGSGPLFGKVSPDGEHRPHDKVLFIEDGRLHYDIGYVGVIQGDIEVDNGEWHTVALRQKDEEVEIFLNGKSIVKEEFTSPDNEMSVMHVGAGADIFPEGGARLWRDGEITLFQFFDLVLSDQELGLDVSIMSKNNKPVLAWKGDGEDNRRQQLAQQAAEEAFEEDNEPEDEDEEEDFELDAINQEEDLEDADNVNATGSLRLQADTSKVRFANIWVRPLADADHQAMIQSLDDSSFRAGKEIYDSICITCHGNLTQEGSIPNSRKFWEAEFKNGNDPYSMYRTLGDGFGQMPQFPFLSPKQRYDVIHYVMEDLVKPNNPKQYFKVNESYLASLPKGIGGGDLTEAMKQYAKGPQYLRMNFGPALNWTYEVEPGNIAYKGIAVRLDNGLGGVSKGRAWMLYDHDTMRVAAAWTGNEFVDWRGIAFDGSHGTHTSIKGKRIFVNPVGPGWARPGTDDWSDPRFRGRDDKPYGPLPREWSHYKGHYLYGNRMVLHYTVGDATILESPGLESMEGTDVFTRTLNIDRSSKDLTLRVASDGTAVALAGISDLSIISMDGFKVLRIPSSKTPINLKLLISNGSEKELTAFAMTSPPAELLEPYTKGGPASWKQSVTTQGDLGDSDAAYVVDTIKAPHNDANPWNSWMRLGGFDFHPNGTTAIVCTWMGDVWRVDGVDSELSELTWTRIASGLFQPLGLVVRGNVIYVTCRDQIAELHDLNGDGEIDWYKSFNNDHQVSEHFHEFAMGLQEDDDGNFYYAKSARHALPALVEHHGTLIKVSADGSTTEVLANGFRAANGVCINPDGSFFVTDQEGHWTPKNRINWVKPGGFYGNMMGYHDRTSNADEEMDQPMVWITNAFDRSPGELMWVRAGGKWGPLEGSLLNLSYGTGRIFIVPHEKVSSQMQGGVVQLPIPDFPTGVMRGRFHPVDGQLYACGMFAWAGNKQQAGGFYRVRYTGKAVHVPVGLHATTEGISLTFTEALNKKVATDLKNYQVKTWSLRRTQNYGSRHFDEKMLPVQSVKLSTDGKSVFLNIPDIKKTWSMEIKFQLMAEDGTPVNQRIHNTIHHLAPSLQ